MTQVTIYSQWPCDQDASGAWRPKGFDGTCDEFEKLVADHFEAAEVEGHPQRKTVSLPVERFYDVSGEPQTKRPADEVDVILVRRDYKDYDSQDFGDGGGEPFERFEDPSCTEWILTLLWVSSHCECCGSPLG